MNDDSYIKLKAAEVKAACISTMQHIEACKVRDFNVEYKQYVDRYNNSLSTKLFKRNKIEYRPLERYIENVDDFPIHLKRFANEGEWVYSAGWRYSVTYGGAYSTCKDILAMCDTTIKQGDDYIWLSKTDYKKVF